MAVLRRERGRVFVGLEGGGDARGHGHPDALALTLQADAARVLEDPGAGSYVDRSLFWYRSTLAHHAPLVNGASQAKAPAVVLNFEDRGGAGWMRKRVQLAAGVSATRACIVLDGYLVDVLEWTAAEAVTITLPVAAGIVREAIGGCGSWRPAARVGAGGEEDGFDFLRAVHEAPLTGAHATWALAQDGRTAHAWYAATGAPRLVHAMGPGVPGASECSRLLLEATGASGRMVGVWAWAEPESMSAVDTVALRVNEPVVATVTTHCGTRAEHGPAEHGWHIALISGDARSSIDLEGGLTVRQPATSSTPASVVPLREYRARCALLMDERHYVATEEPYGKGNAPLAAVALHWREDALVMDIRVTTGHPLVSVGGTPDVVPENPLDNEPADVNADSLQWYLGDPASTEWAASGVLAVLPDGRVRATPLATRWHCVPIAAGHLKTDGWDLHVEIPRDAIPVQSVRVNVTVNERPAWRERRRGQLRLAGGGFRRYIAGAREDATACPIILR